MKGVGLIKKRNGYVEEKYKKEHPPESLPWLLIKLAVYISLLVLMIKYWFLE